MSHGSDHDFFLSYASPDRADADDYARRLRALGASVAFDETHITAGQDWIDRILDLLDSSRICVVFVSSSSAQALVQGHETFLARFLAKKFPDRHQVIPVYLPDAPPQTDLHGLQTTSGYKESQKDRQDIVQDLIEMRDRMGDTAARTMHTINMIDEVAQRWLFQNWGPHSALFELDGTRMQLNVHGSDAGTIRRDQFDAKLSPDELRLIEHVEQKLERLFEEWKENDLDAVTSKDAQERADEFARRMGVEVAKLLDVLDNKGFVLDDHYEHIRGVVAGYYRSH